MVNSIFGLTTLQFFGLALMVFGTIIQFYLHSRDVVEVDAGPFGAKGRIGIIIMILGTAIFVFGTVYNY